MKDVNDYCPNNQADWRKWLELNHEKADAIWLIFYKKKSTKHNLGWSEAVDGALCFGWIDSTKRSIDEEKYKQYFSKRKAKSNWSKVNKAKVKTLIDQELMKEAGSKSIEIAKENGSWSILDGVEALTIPKELSAEFTKHSGSKEFFNSLSNSNKKILLHWVYSAKRNETKQKRVIAIAESAAEKRKPKQFR